ncbi:MAG: hypothetical protein LBF27_10000 [Sphingobacterium sp.]|jgi:hypothetical protein|nr:hypothetical protein [Sphingobacterium sp.]
MKKYVLIVILLIFCVGNEATRISDGEKNGVKKGTSVKNEREIHLLNSCKKQSPQQSVDTLLLPSRYIVTVPLEVNKKKMDVRLQLSKSDFLSGGENYTITEIDEGANGSLPKSAYKCIVETIELMHWKIINRSSYYDTYDYYKNKDFKENDFVSKKKRIFHHGGADFIIVTDVDNDGYEDLLILELRESMRDNDVYQFYRWSEREDKFKLMPDFFGKTAFYGWDKTEKYLITGISDTRERKLYKNKIIGVRLKAIEQCTEYAVSDKFCW